MTSSNKAQAHIENLINSSKLKEKYVAKPSYDYGEWLKPEVKQNNFYQKIIKNRESIHNDAEEKFENVKQKLIKLYQSNSESDWNNLDEITTNVFEKRQHAFNSADIYSERADYINELLEKRTKGNIRNINTASKKMRDIRNGIIPERAVVGQDVENLKENMRVSLESVRLNEKNLQHFLETGKKLDNPALEDEEYLRRGLMANKIAKNIGETSGNIANTIFSAPKAGAYNFGNSMLSVMSKIGTDYEHKKANRLNYDILEVSENARFQEANKKVNKLFAGYGSDISFSNPKYLENLKSLRQAISSNALNSNLSLADKNYLEQLIQMIDTNIDIAEKQNLSREHEFNDNFDKREEKFKNEIQDIVDDKNDALKWNLLCMFVMASPFGQALPVVGVLFSYLDILGHIVGPIFVGDGGFSQGFAQALTDERVFGPFAKLNELIRLDDGVELFFDKTPIIQEFFGKEGMIDTLTRNGVFDVFMSEFSPVLTSSLAYVAVGGVYGYYRGLDYHNREYGPDTSNSKKSAKSVKDSYLKDIEDLLKSQKRATKDDTKSLSQEIEKEFFNLNKKYYRENALIEDLVELINNKNADPKIIKIFSDLEMGDKTPKQTLDNIIKNNQISQDALEELYFNSDNNVKNEASLRMAILLQKLKDNPKADIKNIADIAMPKNKSRPTLEQACREIDADYCDICFKRFNLYDQNQVIDKYRNGEEKTLAEIEERIVAAMDENSKTHNIHLSYNPLENRPSSMLRKPKSVEPFKASKKEVVLSS